MSSIHKPSWWMTFACWNAEKMDAHAHTYGHQLLTVPCIFGIISYTSTCYTSTCMCWFVSIFIGCLVLFPGSSGSVGCDRPCWLRSHSNLGTSVPFLHRWERPQPVGWGDWGFTWRFTSFAQVLPVMAVYPWLENSKLFGSRHIKLWANYDDLIIFTSRSLWVAQQKLTVKEDVLPKNAWREAKRVVSDEFISQLYPYWFILVEIHFHVSKFAQIFGALFKLRMEGTERKRSLNGLYISSLSAPKLASSTAIWLCRYMHK